MMDWSAKMENVRKRVSIENKLISNMYFLLFPVVQRTLSVKKTWKDCMRA
jgi:hypothetical protein